MLAQTFRIPELGFAPPFWRASREKLRYIHRNPVKRGLARRPEDWDGAVSCNGRRVAREEWKLNIRQRR